MEVLRPERIEVLTAVDALQSRVVDPPRTGCEAWWTMRCGGWSWCSSSLMLSAATLGVLVYRLTVRTPRD